jgi:hypothetical protein
MAKQVKKPMNKSANKPVGKKPMAKNTVKKVNVKVKKPAPAQKAQVVLKIETAPVVEKKSWFKKFLEMLGL